MRLIPYAIFLMRRFSYVGLKWENHVKVDPKYFRKTEVDHLCGDAGKARRALDWVPQTSFRQLVRMMVDSDLQLAQTERLMQDARWASSLVPVS